MGFEWDRAEAQIVAEYQPRAFFIKLHRYVLGQEEDDDCYWLNKLRGPFMHEVGHLVQDQATLHGWLDFYLLYHSLESVQRYVVTCPEHGQVLVPLCAQLVDGKYPGTTEPCVMAQIETLRQVTNPSRKWPLQDTPWAYRGSSRAIRTVEVAGEANRVPYIEATFVEGDSTATHTHPIGTREVKEAYSSCVQVLHGDPPQTAANGGEYVAARLMVEGEWESISDHHMVALCHWALQDEAPADRLLYLAKAAKSSWRRDPEPRELYSWCRDLALRDGYPERSGLLLRKLSEVAQKRTGIFKEAMKWYVTTATRFRELHLDPERFFPLDTFLAPASPEPLDDTAWKAALVGFCRDVQIPMVEDEDGITSSLGTDAGSDGAVFFIRGLARLIGLVWGGSKKHVPCPVQKPCHHGLKDGECQTHPWSKGAALPATCSYGAAAATLHLESRTLTWAAPGPPPV